MGRKAKSSSLKEKHFDRALYEANRPIRPKPMLAVHLCLFWLTLLVIALIIPVAVIANFILPFPEGENFVMACLLVGAGAFVLALFVDLARLNRRYPDPQELARENLKRQWNRAKALGWDRPVTSRWSADHSQIYLKSNKDDRDR